MTFSTGYLWAFGATSKSNLQNESFDYRIESNASGSNFPWETDQVTPILRWKDPQQEGSEHPRRGRYSPLWDGGQKADGDWRGVLCFGVLTPLAMGYIDTSQFSTGSVEYAAATIQVPDDNNRSWNAFTCLMHRPIPGQDFEYRDGLYLNVKYRWTMGVLLS